MKIFVYDTYDKLSQVAANFVAAQLLKNPSSHIGLTLGNTPAGMYRELIKLHQEGKVSFSDAWFYNLEEVIGYGPDSPESYRAAYRKLLFDHVGIEPSRMRLPNGLTEDVETECSSFDSLLNHLPGNGLDLQILGLGLDGHIGCNNPGNTLLSASHPVGLSRGRRGMAMGMGSIMHAKCLLMLANGEDKAKAVADMCCAPVTPRCPSTFLQLHPNTIVMLDQAAASQLKF